MAGVTCYIFCNDVCCGPVTQSAGNPSRAPALIASMSFRDGIADG